LTALRSYFESGRVGTALYNELSGASTPNPSTELRAVSGRKKSRKCDLATDLTLPKAIQEQQTQEQRSTNYSDLPRTFLGLFARVLERLSRDVAGTEPGRARRGRNQSGCRGVAILPEAESELDPPSCNIISGRRFVQREATGWVLLSRGLCSWRKIGRRRFCVEKSVCYAAAAGGG